MKKKILAVILFITGILIGVLAKFNVLSSFDSAFYRLLMQIKCEPVTNAFKIITILGNTRFIILLNIIAIIIYFIVKNKNIFLITINSILSPIVNNIFKYIFKRPRPDEALRLITESNYSFPSGHAMISVFFYFTLIILINRSKIRYKKVLITVLLSIIILIGISRVYLGVHYISDVVGGYLIAISIIIFLEMSDKIESTNNRSQ